MCLEHSGNNTNLISCAIAMWALNDRHDNLIAFSGRKSMKDSVQDAGQSTCVGRILSFRFPDGSIQHKFPKGAITRWQVLSQSHDEDGTEKRFAHQHLLEITSGESEREMDRFGYCIVGDKPGASDVWVWASSVIVHGDQMTSVLAEDVS